MASILAALVTHLKRENSVSLFYYSTRSTTLLLVTKRVRVFPTPSNSPTLLWTPAQGPIFSNSILTLSTWRFHRLRTQSQKMPISNPGASDQLTINQRFPQPLTGVLSFARTAHRIQRNSLLPQLQVYYKGINSGTAR